ncbi:hypothetical protein ES705_18572 [subsurface metagenome]
MLENIKNRLKSAFSKAEMPRSGADSGEKVINAGSVNKGSVYISTDRGLIFPFRQLEKFKIEKSSKQIKETKAFLSKNQLITRPYSPYNFIKLISRMPLLSAGIKIIAEDVSSDGWSLIKKGEKDAPEEKKILEDFLNKPNSDPTISLKNIIKFLVISRLSLGDSALEVVRTVGGRVCEIYALNPKNIYLTKKDENGERKYCQKLWTDQAWFVPFKSKKLKKVNAKTGEEGNYDLKHRANEMIYSRESNLESDYYGVPDWMSSTGSILTWISSQEYNLSFFENSGIPDYVIILSSEKGSQASWDDDTVNLITNFLQTEIKGTGNFHKTMTMMLPDGCKAEFKPLQIEKKEGSFILLCRSLEKDVLSVLHIPPYKLSIYEKAGSLNSDVLGKSLADYASNVVEPAQCEYENIINNLIIPEILGRDSIYKFKLNDMSLLGLAEKAKVYVSIFGCGALTPNQMIQKLGLGEPFNGGNSHYISNAYIEIEDSEISKREDEELKFLTGLAEMDQEIKGLIEKN